MLDAALIQQCADPSLKPAIVFEQFVTAAGSNDPLAVTVKSGGRLILVPKATDAGRGNGEGPPVCRPGGGACRPDPFPAGVGVKDASELKPDLVDPCENLRKGTAMFAKVLRIVAKWYGNPNSDDVFPQIFEDAVYAWKTGEFEGARFSQAEDPGGPVVNQRELIDTGGTDAAAEEASPPTDVEPQNEKLVGSAEMRIDLSRIGGK